MGYELVTRDMSACRYQAVTPSQGVVRVSTGCFPGKAGKLRLPAFWSSPTQERQTVATAVSLDPQESAKESIPWDFAFQCNERYLQWDDSAQRQLIKLYVAGKLNQDIPWVEAKLNELAVLLPDMVGKLERLKGDLVLSYVKDTEGLALKLIALREVMPTVNLSELFARHPSLLLELEPKAVAQQLDTLRSALVGVDVEAVIQQEPLLLLADIHAVLDNIRRLVPKADPVAMLVRDPSIVLDMETSRMPTAEGENLM